VAEAARAELEAQKLAGEVARQPLEDLLLEVRLQEGRAEVARRLAETKSLEDGSVRSTAYLVVFLLLVIFILVLALIDPQLLENIGQVFRWAPK
jgi:cytochrome c-type biogenesis protein CcmH/NrfG